MRKKLEIPIAKTSLLENEIQAVLEPLRSGWLVQGPMVESFERKWSEYTGAKHSIAVNSCTSGLLLALAAIGFKPGDEAIVPAFTWISTANVVEQLGGKVIFCDIDLETFNIDVQMLERVVTPNTKAILPVHLFGLPVEMNDLIKFAEKYELSVIEDAACGFGAKYHGRHVGTHGDAGVFSFHPRKTITTGEGGMITTDNDALAEKLICMRDHGAVISDRQRHLGNRPYLLADHIEAGYNFRMTDIQGALGSAQMDRAKEILENRRAIALHYNKTLSHLDWLRTPSEKAYLQHGFQSYACLLQPNITKNEDGNLSIDHLGEVNSNRNIWMERLQESGISTRPATHAVHMLSYYAQKYGLKPEDFPNAFIANQCSISLPLFTCMTDQEQGIVIESVLGASF